MDRKKLLIAAGLIGFVICLFISAFLFISLGSILVSEIFEPSEYNDNVSFNNSTPELTAASIARLNFGSAFSGVSVSDVYLTDDGKYWIVGIDTHDAGGYLEVTIDAKTLMSKRSDEASWRSLDELKASYIAEIQSYGTVGKPQKIAMDGKEIWKVPVDGYDENGTETVEYIYIDLTTGKSKNTDYSFNRAAGTNGWLTLQEIGQVIDKMQYYPNQFPFNDVLRNLYPENNNSSYQPDYWLSFDNSTPETTAISIARLNQGVHGFVYYYAANASLTPDKKYWIVEMYNYDGMASNVVTVDAKTWMSKGNNSSGWKSVDELKVLYIAQLRTSIEESMGEPLKVTMDGKEVWKVPISGPVINEYDEYTGEIELEGYVYVDLATGKSKREGNIFDFMLNLLQGNPDGWLTLKEVDEKIHENYYENYLYYDYSEASDSFRDALRDLYPE